MHQMHHQHIGDSPQHSYLAIDLAEAFRARLRGIATADRWYARAGETIRELRAELAKTIAERADLRQEVAYWRRRAARTAGLDPDQSPPQHYVAALRQEQLAPVRVILAEVDGRPCTISISRHPQAAPDPIREMRDWQLQVAAVREARGELGDAGTAVEA